MNDLSNGYVKLSLYRYHQLVDAEKRLSRYAYQEMHKEELDE